MVFPKQRDRLVLVEEIPGSVSFAMIPMQRLHAQSRITSMLLCVPPIINRRRVEYFMPKVPGVRIVEYLTDPGVGKVLSAKKKVSHFFLHKNVHVYPKYLFLLPKKPVTHPSPLWTLRYSMVRIFLEKPTAKQPIVSQMQAEAGLAREGTVLGAVNEWRTWFINDQ